MAVKIEVKGPIVSNETAWVYHYFGWDACCPKDILSKLDEAAGEDVILEINSPGGVCSCGYEMYTVLMAYQGAVTAHVITAASAASLLVCAADKALASDTCMFMIHNTSSVAAGDYREMQNCADMLKEYNEGIINAYVRKTGKSREELQEMMDKETYMSAQKAIENGFIDDYLFGNPDSSEDGGRESAIQNISLLQVMNAAQPVMTEEQAKEILAGLNMLHDLQNNSSNADSDTENVVQNKKEGEKSNMTLEEIYAEHPELKEEVAALAEASRKEGAEQENKRLQALDMIAASVTGEALNNAKYGENRMEAKELAYQSLIEDGKKAENYMTNAIADFESSGANEVGAGLPEEEAVNEADDMAAYVNAMKGGK